MFRDRIDAARRLADKLKRYRNKNPLILAISRGAVLSLRAHKPDKLVCALPGSPRDTLTKIRPMADELACLNVPRYFQAVGQFYQHFPQVEDSEVMEALKHPSS